MAENVRLFWVNHNCVEKICQTIKCRHFFGRCFGNVAGMFKRNRHSNNGTTVLAVVIRANVALHAFSVDSNNLGCQKLLHTFARLPIRKCAAAAGTSARNVHRDEFAYMRCSSAYDQICIVSVMSCNSNLTL